MGLPDCLRDEAALEKLSDSERVASRAFWTAADALLDKAERYPERTRDAFGRHPGACHGSGKGGRARALEDAGKDPSGYRRDFVGLDSADFLPLPLLLLSAFFTAPVFFGTSKASANSP